MISVGNTLRIRFMSGVVANTNGTPYPVLAEATGDVQGPDGLSLPVGTARLLLACEGSLIDSRALCRLVKMNLHISGGETRDVAVDGWVVGEDGVRGMQGLLHDPIGKMVLGATEGAFVEGAGEGLSNGKTSIHTGVFGDTTSTTESDPITSAFAKGLSGGSKQIVEFFEERKDLLSPAIEVYSGREATAIFTNTVPIPGLYEVLAESF